MAQATAQALLAALTGEDVGYRESELPTSRSLLKEIRDPDDRASLILRLVSPLKDELLSLAASNRTLLTRGAETRSFV